MKFRPLHDRVVVKRVDEDTKTKGGIIIPETAQEKPMQGKIIAVGPGARDESGKLVPLDVKKGDTVLGGAWCTKRLVDNHVAALGAEGDLHRVSENVNAAEHSLAGFAAEADFFCSHVNIPFF